MEYAVFADERRYDHGRFRSIAAVSLPAGTVVDLSTRLAGALAAAGVPELKWSSLGARAAVVRCATAFVDLLLEEIPNGLRADVLIWDTEDARHRVPNRDDIANYERALTPAIRTFRQVDSETTPLSQLADLLAGMAAYTRSRPAAMLTQFGDPRATGDRREAEDGNALSKRDKGRFSVISHLYHGCRSRRIAISLRAHGYLRTADPKQPINFWHYQPQHPADKAPVAPCLQTGALV